VGHDKQIHLITMFNWLNVVVSLRAQRVVRTLLKTSNIIIIVVIQGWRKVHKVGRFKIMRYNDTSASVTCYR